jgi:hypothetical protein
MTKANETAKTETKPSTAPDTKTETKPSTAPDTKTETKGLPGFRVTRNVTLPLSKWKNDQPKFLLIESPIFQGKQIAQKDGQPEEKPADLMNCVDLETGEQVQVIVGTVLKGTLQDEYPDNSYVGKYFSITQLRDPGKKYNTYSVQELTKHL